MKAPLLAIRRCALALSVLYLAIFASYFVPYLFDPQENLWQVLLPPWNSLFAFSRAPLILIACIMFFPLAFPLATAWTAVLFPLRIMSLVNVRLCLPLIFAAWFFWVVLALELYSPASGLQGVLRLVLFAPALGLSAAFVLTLLLARYLRAFQLREDRLHARLALPQKTTEQEAEPEIAEISRSTPAPRHIPLFRLIACGLLCQLVFFLSLFLPYTEVYDSVTGTSSHITGWQTLGFTFPFALLTLFLFALPLLPILFPLLYRVPLLFRNIQREVFHRGGVYLSYWLTLVCFILSSIVLEYSLLFVGADSNRAMRWLDAAFGIPVAAFFLALFCSGTLRVFLLRRASAMAS
jgi:hypothetical protein